MIQFHSYFSDGLKPPTSCCCCWLNLFEHWWSQVFFGVIVFMAELVRSVLLFCVIVVLTQHVFDFCLGMYKLPVWKGVCLETTAYQNQKNTVKSSSNIPTCKFLKNLSIGWNPANQLRLVGCPIIYRVLYIVWDFFHQQYLLFSQESSESIASPNSYSVNQTWLTGFGFDYIWLKKKVQVKPHPKKREVQRWVPGI